MYFCIYCGFGDQTVCKSFSNLKIYILNKLQSQNCEVGQSVVIYLKFNVISESRLEFLRNA